MKRISFSTVLISLVLIASLIGELYRFHGFLLLDFCAPAFVTLWWMLTQYNHKKISYPPFTLPALGFVSIGFISLLLNSYNLASDEFLQSAFYGIRWISLFALSVIVYNQSPKDRSITWKGLVGFTTLLSIAGFIQLYFVPDFSSYEELGWDPHKGRLLSTWFDPNLLGGYLVFFTPLLLGFIWEKPSVHRWSIPLALLIVLALALTLSRSSYVALLMAMFIFGFLRSIKGLALGICCLTLLGLTIPNIENRFHSLLENIQSVTTDSYTLPDASARLRYESWEVAWNLFLENPILGHGYNAYKSAGVKTGFIRNPNIHAASGSDASLLTILATTGIVGFLSFLSTFLLMLQKAWQRRKNTFMLGFFSGLCGLLVHSIFVNSLLFPLLLAPFWIAVGIVFNQKPDETFQSRDLVQ